MANSIHVWEGPEEELIHFCHIRRLTITKLTEDEAEGSVTLKDYLEGGIVFSCAWQARFDVAKGWIAAKKPDEDERSIFIDRRTGEHRFTLHSGINMRVARFIQRMIKEFQKSGKAWIGASKYDGPMKEYAGPCLCAQLEQSNVDTPFPWKEHTGGCYPERCFACSCGTKWWSFQPENHKWAKVIDNKAWEMLMTYNGVDVERVLSMKGEGGFKLAQTLRDEGLALGFWG